MPEEEGEGGAESMTYRPHRPDPVPEEEPEAEHGTNDRCHCPAGVGLHVNDGAELR